MINERKLTPAELEKREKVIMKMKGNKRDLVKKYGKDAEAVMYGRATNMAKKKTENMRNSKITELIKDALKNPKKADLDKDGKLSSYEKTRGKAIEKSMASEDLESGQYGDPKVGNYDITSQNDNEAGDIEALSAAGLEEATAPSDSLKGIEGALKNVASKVNKSISTKKLSDLSKMGTADMNLWHVVKLIDAGILNDSDKLKALKALDPSRELNEDIDIGHEDNEPGMLQGDLYQIGKSAMEIYQLLDDMEGEGEVDLPSWWQAKIFKAKEAIVGAAEYLDFELKEPAIDAVVDTIEPLEIEVDPLGETVEDFITSVDDLTEIEIPSSLLTKINAEVKSPKSFASLMINLYDAIQDKESVDFSKNQKFGRALSFLKDLADDEVEDEDSNTVNEGVINEGAFDVVKKKLLGLKDKIVNKIGASTIEKFKVAAKKALGKDEIEVNDITLDNAKKVADELKGVSLQEGIFDVFKSREYNDNDPDNDDEGIKGLVTKLGLSAGLLGVVGTLGVLPFVGIIVLIAIASSALGEGEVDEVAGYDRRGEKQSDDDKDSFKKRPQAGIAALLNKEEVDESFGSLAKKIDKQKGKSKKDAANIAGYIANIKRKGGGSGPTAKQKKRMAEDETNESFSSLAKKIDKQKGKSKKDAANIAGYIANIKRKGGGSGPTAKQKKRMAETILKKIRK